MKKFIGRKELVFFSYIPFIILCSVIAWFFPKTAIAITRSSIFFWIFALYLVISRLGKIRLSADQTLPSLSAPAWLGSLWGLQISVTIIFLGFMASMANFIPRPQIDDPSIILYQPLGQMVADWIICPWGIFIILATLLAYVHFRQKKSFTVLAVAQTRFQIRANKLIEIIFNTSVRSGYIFAITALVAADIFWFNNTWVARLFYTIPFGLEPGTIIIFVLLLGVIYSKRCDKLIRYMWTRDIPFGLLVLLSIVFIILVFQMVTWLLLPALPYLNQHVWLAFLQGYVGKTSAQTWIISSMSWWICATLIISTLLAKISRGRTIRSTIIAASIYPLLLWIFTQQNAIMVQQFLNTLFQPGVLNSTIIFLSMALLVSYLCSATFRQMLNDSFLKIHREKTARPPLMLVRRMIQIIVSFTALYAYSGILFIQLFLFTMALFALLSFLTACYAFYSTATTE